jgi:SAM-dependent methyltransferase
MKQLYHRHVLPRLIDLAMRGDDIDRLRLVVVGQARGRVLEVGFGTGLNARHYPTDIELTVIDDNPGMNTLAKRRLAQAGLPAQLAVLSGESLPFADGSFDTVVVTFTLCSIKDVARAIGEMKRVLAKGGQLLFLEHGRAEGAGAKKVQRLLNPVWRPCAGGCHLDRAPEELLRSAGLKVEVQGTARLPTGAVFGSVRYGSARRAD